MTKKDSFPYVISNDHSGRELPQLIRKQFAEIKEQLMTTGAVLFKSFGIDTPDKLEACVGAFPGSSINYSGGNSPRTNVHGQVYTSTEHPAQSLISLHNELSYAKDWPSYIFFCCAQPAEDGGHTIIANSRQILKDLPEEIKTAFKEKGVQYIRNLHGGFGAGPSWQDTFETSDRLAIEQHCRDNDILFEWGAKQKLKLIEKRPAIISHPELAVEVWFNQADQFHPSTNAPEVYEALMELYEDNLQSM
ncbi:MAG: TauD/TfdA family dioxygenase, partial [Bacteroidota bacterium]